MGKEKGVLPRFASDHCLILDSYSSTEMIKIQVNLYIFDRISPGLSKKLHRSTIHLRFARTEDSQTLAWSWTHHHIKEIIKIKVNLYLFKKIWIPHLSTSNFINQGFLMQMDVFKIIWLRYVNSEWVYELMVSPKMPTKNLKDLCPLSNKLPGQKSFLVGI